MLQNQPMDVETKQKLNEEGLWSLHFDGAMSKMGARSGAWITSPTHDANLLSFKLYFECTTNIAEYESLILRLFALKKFKVKIVSIYGDSKLIIGQVKGVYQAKHPKMRAYKNLVLELLEEFDEFTISLIMREHNSIADSLAISISLFKITIYPNKKYEIQVKQRPSIPDNFKNWQVFEDNYQIKIFMENDEVFVNIQIDDEN